MFVCALVEQLLQSDAAFTWTRRQYLLRQCMERPGDEPLSVFILSSVNWNKYKTSRRKRTKI